jgi:serine/threonine-protein kinase
MKVGKYELRKVVGRGSIGVVHEATDLVLKRTVAIKTLPLIDLDTPLGQEKYQRFQREAQAAARLYHPNIAITFDYGETSAFAYIVMEFLEGPSLREMLEKSRFSIGQIRTTMQGLLAGLQHSHSLGVVHRDVKPANILFSKSREVKITDFGIARLDDSDLTQLGSQVGTPAYMSPEQVLGDKVDGRSDIYSAGVVLYEMLTGRRPFEGSTNSVMHKIVHLPAPRVSDLTPAFSGELDGVVGKVLAKDADDRYQTPDAFWRALDEHLHEPPAAILPDTDPPEVESTVVWSLPERRDYSAEPLDSIRPRPPNRTRVVALGAAAACLVVAAGVWMVVHLPGSGPTRQEAQNSAVAVATQLGAASGTTPPAVTERASSSSGTPPADVPAPARASASIPPDTTALVERSADLLAGLHGVTAGIPCSLVRAELGKDAITLDGVTALGEASELEMRGLVRQSIARLSATPAVVWRVRRIDGPYCAVFDLLRPAAETVRLITTGDAGKSPDQIAAGPLRIRMPAFAGALMVDAYSADGNVRHLFPVGAGTSPDIAAGAEVAVDVPQSAADANGSTRPGLLVVTASPTPLRGGERRSEEAAAAYLSQLSQGITHAQATGVPVKVDAASVISETMN